MSEERRARLRELWLQNKKCTYHKCERRKKNPEEIFEMMDKMTDDQIMLFLKGCSICSKAETES